MKLFGISFDKTAADKNWGFTEASAPRFSRGSDCGVLICHGFGGTPDNMRCLYDRAVELGYTVEMPLLKGHATTLRDLERATAADWIRDADDALWRLRTSGCKKILLVGLSMGALLMAELAAKNAGLKQIVGVMLICPPVKMQRYLRFTASIAPAAPFLLTADSFEHTGTELYCGTASKKLRDIESLGKLVKKDAELISAPTLLVEAENDNRVDPVSFEILEARIPDRRYVLIREAPHGIPYSPKKDELTDLFEEFAESRFSPER